ncbi:Cas8a1 family CRISPR/Cas system-associated protein [Brachyspira pulli]|uniref:Cas8a1 family CRISPR/Cas system-associated protein n=1 Tax=Brachyspira pulli TaxID=310721 RepID=UPI0030063026
MNENTNLTIDMINSNYNNYFKISLNNFLYNAGVIGFIEVLNIAKINYLIDNKDLYIEKASLVNDNLAQAYIYAICDKFKEDTFYTKIKSSEKDYEKELNLIVKQFDKKSEENSDIKGGKYRQAIKKIGIVKNYDYESELIKLPSDERKEKIKDLLENFDDISKSILNFNSVTGKITPFWGQFAFLDYANTSEYPLTFIIEKYFTNPIKNIAKNRNEDTIKDFCFSCQNPIYEDYVYETLGQKSKKENENKKIKTKQYNTSFIKSLAQDLEGKSSHFWNHNPDVIICPICAFIYACMPIGFTNIKNDFIFINNSESIKTLLIENKNYKLDLLKQHKDNINYFQAYIETKIEKNEKEIEGIEFIINQFDINKKENKYIIKNIDKITLSLLNASKNYLNIIYAINISCKLDNKTSLDIFNECIDNIFRNVNQYNLIHKIFITKYPDNIKKDQIPELMYYIALIQITKNYIFKEKGGENMQIDRIKKGEEARNEGSKLRWYISQNIEAKGEELNDRIKGISFKLANAIQTCNFNLFRDVLFHTYIALGKNIPTIFMDMRESNNTFKDLGYSYLAGLNGAYINKNKEENQNNEEEGE